MCINRFKYPAPHHEEPAFKFSVVILCLLILLITRGTAQAQPDNFRFERISIEDGLSQSIVEGIAQDSLGFMWFITEDGLNKYDGYSFKVYKHIPDNPFSISHNELKSILPDNNGKIWIGTFQRGLNLFDSKHDRFYKYRHNPADITSLSSNTVRAILKDKKGRLWFGTEGGGLNKFDDKTGHFTHFMNNPDDPGSLSFDDVRVIYEDRAGNLWLGTWGGGLNLFNESTGRFICYKNDPRNPNSISNNFIKAIYEDSRGILWVGTYGGGLNKFDKPLQKFTCSLNKTDDPYSISSNLVTAVTEDEKGNLLIGTDGGGLDIMEYSSGRFYHNVNEPSSPGSISGNRIYSLFKDAGGVLWVGTYGAGLNKADLRRKEFRHYKKDPANQNSLNDNIVWAFSRDKNGVLWIGTNDGGINRFDRKNNLFSYYKRNRNSAEGPSHNSIRFIYEDRSGKMWIGTNGGGLNEFDKKTEKFKVYKNNPYEPETISQDELRAVCEDGKGNLWIGTFGGGLNKFIKETGTFVRYMNNPDDNSTISNNFIRCIIEDKNGLLWIGTQGGGLNKFNKSTGKFERYMSNPEKPGSLSNDYVFSIYEDKSGILWIGTFGGGLNKFDKERGVIKYYSEEDGLPNNSVYGILEDEKENLWLSTNNGLSKFNIVSEKFTDYGEQDGLQSAEFNGGAYYKSKNGEMFFGGINGFNSFYPFKISDNPYKPRLAITNFKLLNRPVNLIKGDELQGGSVSVPYVKSILLSYTENFLSFEFAALHYSAPRKNKYSYMLEGFDNDWIYTDAGARSATYTNLSPGKYVFRVKGTNSDGVWSDNEASVIIKISPPFWGTLWFQILGIMLLSGLAYTGYRRRMITIRMKTELSTAHNAQMTIMPRSDPVLEELDISGICLPANEVGGDFFDYYWMNKERTQFGIAVGDVSGKAMKAAMTAVMTSGMIYAKTFETSSVKNILTSLNSPLFYKTERSMFTALCLASINLSTRLLTITNAGLNEPLLKTGDGIIQIKNTGPSFPLGLVENAPYEEVEFKLNRGDILIMFTDGITEAADHSKEFFGYDALRLLLEKTDTGNLSAAEIKTGIIDKVKEFSGSAHQHDDMTVVVVKVR